MNWFDFLIIAVIAGSTYWSFRQGLVMELSFFLGTVIGLIIALVLYPVFTPFFKAVLGQSHHYGATVAFGLLFILSGGIVAIIGIFLQKFVWLLQLKGLDHFLGGVVGFIKAFLGVTVLLVMLSGIQADDPPDYLVNSSITESFIDKSTAVMKAAPPVFGTFMKDYGRPAIDLYKKQQESEENE